MKKFVKKQPLKIAGTCPNRTQQRKLRTPNNSKIQNIIKCNMQRMKTANKRFLFVCSDIELNPGPVNTSYISALIARLAFTKQSRTFCGIWADHIIIQAIGNTNNLHINITESAPNFSESTTVSSIYGQSEAQRRNLRDTYVGHLDELHYVSTTPTTQSISAEITYQATKANPKAILQNPQLTKTSSKESMTVKDIEKRK